MNRRTAIGGILGLTGIGVTSFVGYKYFKGSSNTSRGLLENHMDLLAELVEVIIPTTTTPGAKSAGVHNFILFYMEDCSPMKEYNNFYSGLKDLQSTCLDTYGKSFENCSESQKKEILEDLAGGLGSSGLLMKINNKLRGRSFFNILKTLTVEGYCSSYMGATEHLEYRQVPGRYNAIIELSDNQKAWATR